jgi:hypothetical protein
MVMFNASGKRKAGLMKDQFRACHVGIHDLHAFCCIVGPSVEQGECG